MLCVKLKDRHEVCFVGDEAFRILSQEDPHADSLLTAVSNIRYMLKFTSVWYRLFFTQWNI